MIRDGGASGSETVLMKNAPGWHSRGRSDQSTGPSDQKTGTGSVSWVWVLGGFGASIFAFT